MTPDQLKTLCQAQIDHPILGGDNAKISLVLKGSWGKRDTRRLCPGGPVGQILSEVGEGQILVLFSAKEIIDFLTPHD